MKAKNLLDDLAGAIKIDMWMSENAPDFVKKFIGDKFMEGHIILDNINAELQKAIDDTYICKCLGF